MWVAHRHSIELRRQVRTHPHPNGYRVTYIESSVARDSRGTAAAMSWLWRTPFKRTSPTTNPYMSISGGRLLMSSQEGYHTPLSDPISVSVPWCMMHGLRRRCTILNMD
jgi:hypothetical protein